MARRQKPHGAADFTLNLLKRVATVPDADRGGASVRASRRRTKLRTCVTAGRIEWQRKPLFAWQTWALFVLGLLGGLVGGCAEETPSPVLPPGDWVYGDAASISSILEPLSLLHGTPVARSASQLRERLAGCEQFVAHSQGVQRGNPWALLGTVRCVARGEVPASIAALRAGDDLAFAFEFAPGRRVRGRLARAQSGGVSIVASVEVPEASGLGALLVPAEEPPGTVALSPDETLVHARLRPASGLNVAALISQGSQADQMFRLRSELFLGTVLDGTWEFAIYMPRPEFVTPPMALALDYSLRPAAKAAMETFVSELEATWPIHHSEYAVADYAGACFHDLRLLPDLSPCYVMTERSIVIGWNPSSVSLALGLGASRPVAAVRRLGEDGGLIVRLGRLNEADRRLQRQLGGGQAGGSLDYVWDELRVEGKSDGERLQLRVSLEMGGAS